MCLIKNVREQIVISNENTLKKLTRNKKISVILSCYNRLCFFRDFFKKMNSNYWNEMKYSQLHEHWGVWSRLAMVLHCIPKIRSSWRLLCVLCMYEMNWEDLGHVNNNSPSYSLSEASQTAHKIQNSINLIACNW